PAWDARGVGPLAWQGISCLDVSTDGLRIVVGTIAPSGDPNVAVLDEQGKVVSHYSAGQRWIGDVAWGGDSSHVYALSTMPAGQDEVASRAWFARPADAVTVSLAVSPAGDALVGCATNVSDAANPPANLFLLKHGTKQPLWTRPAMVDVDAAPVLEPGEYGTP